VGDGLDGFVRAVQFGVLLGTAMLSDLLLLVGGEPGACVVVISLPLALFKLGPMLAVAPDGRDRVLRGIRLAMVAVHRLLFHVRAAAPAAEMDICSGWRRHGECELAVAAGRRMARRPGNWAAVA